jgi:hypothetical protein
VVFQAGFELAFFDVFLPKDSGCRCAIETVSDQFGNLFHPEFVQIRAEIGGAVAKRFAGQNTRGKRSCLMQM